MPNTNNKMTRDEFAPPSGQYTQAMERLLHAVQELSLARDLEQVQRIVRRTARELTGCDGATFVLRDGDKCFYADEDAIEPLWKGNRFPMPTCISGWAMLNRKTAVIPDIYADERIPHEAYRPTFVKSLVMVPIRTLAPIGAIGNYWAQPHQATADEVRLLQALADSTSIAMENLQVYGELEQRVRDRTAALERANQEIHKLSITDELTGLLNRRGFYVLADQALALARRNGEQTLLAFVDVDGLKRVNDALGHDAGDAMIADVARVLRSTLRQSDIIARVGGDEFCVIATNPETDGQVLRERLLERLEQANAAADKPYRLSASIGFVESRAVETATLDQLILGADEHMYAHKKARAQARLS